MASADVSYGPPIGKNTREFWSAKVGPRLGVLASSLDEYWETFANAPNHFGTAGTGGTGVIDNSVTGMFGLNSGVTGSSFKEYFLGGGNYSATLHKRIPGGATSKWAVFWRGKLGTTIDAQTITFLGARNDAGTAFVRIGANGGVSTTNWTVDTSGTDLDSGVAVDTNVHDFLLWRDGTTTYFEIDGIIRASGANAFPASAIGLMISTFNGTTAASRSIFFSCAGLWTVKP